MIAKYSSSQINRNPVEIEGFGVGINQDVVVGIDASRNRSGGAIANIVGIISEGSPLTYGIRELHVWAYEALLDKLPDKPWLKKHNPIQLERSLIHQVWWQFCSLAKEAKKAGCDIMFTTDASTVCRFHPMVVMSQDMLSYEPGIMKLFGFTKKYFRLLSILLIQNRAFRFADGVIFLTKHAAKVIQESCGNLKHIAYIPHGVGHNFKNIQKTRKWPNSKAEPIKCIYVSNAAMYKHQWVVVRAIASLRKRGYNINLTLVGGGTGRAQKLLIKQMAASDPQGIFITQMDFIPQKELPVLLANADIFIFASSCEAFGISVVEAMAVGLPIACAERSCIPELVLDGGIYFNPEDDKSIADAVDLLIEDEILREKIAQRAKEISQQYSWSRCANETFAFIKETYIKYNSSK